MMERELSLVDLNSEERQVIKTYISNQKQSLINSKYPVTMEKHSKSEKLALAFMKNLKSNFAYKDKKSLVKSFVEDNSMFLDEIQDTDFFGIRQPNFGGDNLFLGDATNEEARQPQKKEKETFYNGATDQQLHEWYNEQKLINAQ